MPKVALYNTQGSQVGDIDLNENVFGIEPNEGVVHEAVVMQLASMRRGTSSTKSRGEVRGGGRKPWRQKGTGRARAGTIRSPLWRGGAITFGPKPRDYKYSIPKKKRRLALRSVLSAKVIDGEMVVLDQLAMAEPKTKEMISILSNFEARKTLVVTADSDEVIFKSARNIPGVTSLAASSLNVYDVINHDKLIITKDAVSKVEEVLA
ncbi:LSU ribosomal protein L4P [Desulfonispora thiosulfatigenes DSM 11270]|uniref:Large ribosomal subunit protein uL4 n=1 Tax=Desulfonispora thiosulfatigenes DSM 11270 TaxID=656914 RepID=A0A1W1USD5_DESTI|nr:50S ribosomal protein L4 [Desulfonispora thiosulfatigenes]SMB84007.1 LSU ribosomal protein L4P [Desulfonispora thiosulfatigenes DSM 11270]